MVIGVTADTHGSRIGVCRIEEAFEDVDLIFHAGDFTTDARYIQEETGIKTIAVAGNCDFDETTPDDRLLEFEGHSIFLTHGHRYGVKRSMDSLINKATELNAGICIFGHTHISGRDERNGCLFFNPGSPAHPRLGVASCAILTLEKWRPPRVEFFEFV
jgi:putative phosphoesterase